MERMGVVVEQKGKFSKVKLMRDSACGSCGACQMGDESKEVFLMARNEPSAEIGDIVEVSMPTSGILSAAFIMYVIPLLSLFVGIVLGSVLFKGDNGELFTALLGLVLMGMTFMAIKVNEKKLTKSDKFNAQILSIVQKNHEDLFKL